MIYSQCDNDSCGSALNTLANTPYEFCNYDCNAEYYGHIQAGQWGSDCLHISYDQWFQVDYSGDGYMCLSIFNGNCFGSYSVESNGWQMQLYQNPCDSLELIWSTACYWMTDDTIAGNPPVINEFEYTGIGEDYDPHRQNWDIHFVNMEQGTYYVQIDPFNTCEGCGVFQWCDTPILMGHEDDPENHIESESEGVKRELYLITDILGQTTLERFNTVLLYYYTDGTAEKKMILR